MLRSVQIQRLLQHAAFWTVITAVVISALAGGLILRRYAWYRTEPIRFTEDINNAFRQGTAALRVGYFNRYDQDKSDPTGRFNAMPLDYAPGRLAIATLWARWVHEKLDGPLPPGDHVTQWRSEFYDRARSVRRQYELCAPMLRVNLTGEILSSIAIFLLVRRYTQSRNRPPADEPNRPFIIGAIAAIFTWIALAFVLRQIDLSLAFSWQVPALVWLRFAFPSRRATISGLVGALFFWFNPALIWNAHCWPQWDSWVLPFFLWAVLCASLDCWFIAGCLIAAGAMFKGQILFGAPIFLLWPLWQLRLIAIVRWVVGVATATAVITSGWLLRTAGNTPGFVFVPGHVNDASVGWIVSMAISFVLMVVLLRLRWLWYAKLPVLAVVIGLIAWRFFQLDNTPQWLPGVWFSLAWAAVVPVLLWPRSMPQAKIPAALLVTAATAIGLWGGSANDLQKVDALLLISSGLALAQALSPKLDERKTATGSEVLRRSRSTVQEADAAKVGASEESGSSEFLRTGLIARSKEWRPFTMRAGGILLGLMLLSVHLSPRSKPLLFVLAVLMSGALLLWGAFHITEWSWQIRLPVGWLLTSLVLWPFLHLTQGLMISAAAATLRVGLILFYAPRRAIGYTAAGWMAAALFLCIPLFDGSRTWFDTGLASPTSHRENMNNGQDNNLPTLLSSRWGWEIMDPVMTLDHGPFADRLNAFMLQVEPKYWHHGNAPVRLPIKYLLVGLWVVAVVLSSIGAAVHDVGRRPRFLLALSAPWIAMFAVMVQMHQRYLLWGASISATAAALNPGYALLHLLLSTIAMSQEFQSMCQNSGRMMDTFAYTTINGWYPGIGWAVLLIAIIFTFLTVRPVRSRNSGR